MCAQISLRRLSLEPAEVERYSAGKAIRQTLPRSCHAAWEPPASRAGPIALLHYADRHRLKSLLPIRYGRLLESPWAFLRGSAIIMASDLAGTPVTGLRSWICGDAHLDNFGGFATPERHVIFGHIQWGSDRSMAMADRAVYAPGDKTEPFLAIQPPPPPFPHCDDDRS